TGFGIACYGHLTDRSLRSFRYTHFNINRVAINSHFHWVDVEEEISIILVQRRHVYSGRVVVQALIKFLLVIHIAFIYTQHTCKVFVVVKEVAIPGDIAVIVLVTLVYYNTNSKAVFAYIVYCIRDDNSITVTFCVVKVKQELLVVLVLRPLE